MAVSDYQRFLGESITDAQGGKIGKVADLWDDGEGNAFASVHTGLFGGRASFVPLAEATTQGDSLVVPYSKDQVKDAPNIDEREEMSYEDEQRLYSHYGVATGATGTLTETAPGADTVTGSAADAGYDTSGATTDDAMTRSEQRLQVGTQQTEAGRARLRKHVVTENVTTTVPVSHEEVRLEREPITEANRGDALGGPDLSEEEHEIVLTEERPVVGTETVPVERVRLGTEGVTEQREVGGEVSHEEISLDEGTTSKSTSS